MNVGDVVIDFWFVLLILWCNMCLFFFFVWGGCIKNIKISWFMLGFLRICN